MGGFPDVKAELVDATFDAFGEPAMWSGIAGPVTVRYRGQTGQDRYGGNTTLAQATHIEVRASEVPKPSEGDEVVIADGVNAGTYDIVGEPERDARRVWMCGVVQR